MKKKIKEWMDKHPTIMKILKVTGIITILVLVYEAGFSRGKDYGVDNLIEDLIHTCENGDGFEKFTYSSSDESLGDLMYEINCECIGD